MGNLRMFSVMPISCGIVILFIEYGKGIWQSLLTHTAKSKLLWFIHYRYEKVHYFL